MLIGYSNADFTNAGATNTTFGQPININVLAPAGGSTGLGRQAADGSYIVTSGTAIPATATGQGTAAIQGHPAFDPGRRRSSTRRSASP